MFFLCEQHQCNKWKSFHVNNIHWKCIIYIDIKQCKIKMHSDGSVAKIEWNKWETSRRKYTLKMRQKQECAPLVRKNWRNCRMTCSKLPNSGIENNFFLNLHIWVYFCRTKNIKVMKMYMFFVFNKSFSVWKDIKGRKLIYYRLAQMKYIKGWLKRNIFTVDGDIWKDPVWQSPWAWKTKPT